MILFEVKFRDSEKSKVFYYPNIVVETDEELQLMYMQACSDAMEREPDDIPVCVKMLACCPKKGGFAVEHENGVCVNLME